MSSRARGPLELSFNVGPFPVTVEPFFWLTTALLGASSRITTPVEAAVWAAVCFVSILVHELGHALVGRAFGARSYIRLHWMGGTCHADRALSRWRDVLMSAAGPGANFLLGGLVGLVAHVLPPTSFLGYFTYGMLQAVNFGWGLFNLLPVLPLDGGHILAGFLGPTRRRAAYFLSTVVALAVIALALHEQARFRVIFFALLALQNVQALLAEQSAPRVRRQRPAPPEPDALPRGWTALHAGQLHEAARLAGLARSAASTAEALNAARDLAAWVALAEGDAGAALRHLEKVAPPSAARALSWALAMEAAGAPERALPHALRALQQEPSDTTASLAVRLLLGQGQLEEAERACTAHAWKSAALADSQRGAVALARGQHALAAGLYAAAFGSAARAADAVQAATAHARGGQLEQAAQWLSRALDAGYEDLAQLASDPALAPVLQAAPGLAARLAASA
ncbi:hypothetical protein FGE12_13675 [Aggregicoccus sp. 17bor-14]|uniref:site-2 protease family protein n=1 Tax=Myxococcaceae TaxID=31 RepID=UPI00129CC363|nr:MULTISPECIES: site-2 protease family protein [Myxococcaceae]MBF5043442.1 site-2 protease family protein [Simulacricoccus sp. 17bor-14]MRI89200.1 hypothetical protein [Aggregicoccus sp. 17bor-14]